MQGRRETEALLEACPHDEVELAAPVDAAWRALQRGFERLATHPKAPVVAVVVLTIQAIGAPLIAGVVNAGVTGLSVTGVTVGSLLSATFTFRGWLQLRKGNRARAVRLFELAVLVSLLMTQVFQFAGTQFAAAGGMLLDLVLLGLLRAERDRMQREAELAKKEAAATTPLGLPPDPAAPRFPEDPSDPVRD
ncbi:drug/metabolite transporter superfamily protein YnfA [Kribbella sandramycini]|uniref:Drug/metabolite transporter superfamily protein YnfA n=1 Tax=Kribbella sandramycini TaxID=60450 RepID=A0A841SRE8_9ACTN|nr:drug/metabolite transporter superfamily protein YnfA [Kribbella sandramycini]